MSFLVEKAKKEGIASAAKFLLNRGVRALQNWKPVWTPRRTYIPLDSVSIERPVFFLGTQGGGLTLVSRTLRRSGQFVMIGGGSAFWMGNDEMDKFHVGHESLPDEMALRSPGYHNMTGREEDHPIFGLERSWAYATDELLPRYRMTRDDYSEKLEREFKNFIRRSIRAYSEDGRESRFLDMSQSYSLKVPLLREFFPEAKFIVVTRNPYVMCWREVTRRPDHKYRLWNKRPSFEEGLRLAAQHWGNTYRIALDDLGARDDWIRIKFEKFLEEPKEKIREMSVLCGLKFKDNMLPSENDKIPLGSKASKKWHPIRKTINKKYKNEISKEAKCIINEEINKEIEKTDY
ncbi:sulfotransferase [Salinibacter grassmerensis]|uniref:sulfotransferase n=1 Tax=Salinibacter grassmerensis TaxID=3040353 RepID=UPI0021E742B5|nr:sulfotransferase [Salinibacter grassmerensis]